VILHSRLSSTLTCTVTGIHNFSTTSIRFHYIDDYIFARGVWRRPLKTDGRRCHLSYGFDIHQCHHIARCIGSSNGNHACTGRCGDYLLFGEWFIMRKVKKIIIKAYVIYNTIDNRLYY